MLSAVIVDDERHSRETLERLLLKHCPEVGSIEKCITVEEAIEAIHKNVPDIVFLDVEMPDGGGFDLLKQLKEINFEIIFTTAFSQYAIQAIRFSALDYLMKPIVEEDLIEAVRKASNKISGLHQRQKIDTLLNNVKYLNTDKKIALPTLTGLEFVTLGKVIRCESDNTYTIFHMADKSKIIVSKSIGEYEELLMDYHFFRVHQSHLVNLRYVKNYQKGEGGMIVMEDNSAVDVSRRRKEQLIARLSAL